MAEDDRFRQVASYASHHGFVGGFPNFHEADYGQGVVYGTILLRDSEAAWRDVPAAEYGGVSVADVPAMFRAANDYAGRQGYAAAFPNFHHGNSGGTAVYGTMLIEAGITEWRDVLRTELNVFHIEDVPGMMRAASDYAARHGFAAGFPTFHQSGQGSSVVCGLVLFRTGRTVWRDIPADLLRRYAAPPQPWAIVLCHLSDRPPTPQSEQRYIDFFTERGLGTGGAFDYWRDVSYGVAGLSGSRVFGWFNLGRPTPELLAFSGGAQRQQAFNWGLDAARANGVDLSRYSHRIVVLNGGATNHAKTGGGVLLSFADDTPLESTFIVHEMGHELGLDHSFGENPAPCAAGDARPGAYCDMFDIMSAMNVHSFVDGQHRKSGPTLNAVTREKLGWLHPSRVWNRTLTYLAENVTLAAINRPDIDGYLFAKLLAPGRDGSPLSVYTIEFKEPAGWDRGFLHDHVVIHEIRTDGLVRLITNSNGGLLDLHPDREFVFPGGELVVRLLAIDGAAHRANIRVEARRIQYDWRWCRKCHGLFWAGGSTSAGRCPAGGAHDRGASSDYGLAMDLPEALGQRDWRWCEKCAGLFWAGSGQAAGTCPAGAAHRRGGSSDYTIVMGLPIPSGQSDWRWCFRCGGLFWAGGQLRAGACPAGSTHNQGSSSDYSVLFRS